MTTDKQLLKRRFTASLHQYNALAVVQQEICAQLGEMIGRLCTEPLTRVLEIGSGTGFLTRHLLELYPQAAWFINDLVEESALYLDRFTSGRQVDYLWGDAEVLALPDSLDLIASASVIQWFDHPSLFFGRAAGSLHSGGYLCFSTFGPGNFHEIKSTTGEGLFYSTQEELQHQLREAGYVVIENLEYTRQLLFDTPTDVLRHIKATGVNSIRNARWGKCQLRDFETKYREKFSTSDGAVTLTYHPILIVAQKR